MNVPIAGALVAAAMLLAGACTSPPAPARTSIIWQKVGSWSGHGNAQTESFIGQSASFRVDWETRNEMASGTGRFRLTLHSAVSGRPLQVAVDQHGNGRGSSYISDDPRPFHMVVDSRDVDWSFTVHEGFAASAVGARR